MVDVEGKTIENFHRNNDPCYTEKMHGWIGNPFLSSPKTRQSHDDEQRTSKIGRQSRTDNPTENRPNKDHACKKAKAESTLSMDSHVRDTIGRRCFIDSSISVDGTSIIRLLIFSLEKRSHFANSFIDVVFENFFSFFDFFLNVLNHELTKVNPASTAEFFGAENIIFHIIVV